MQLATSQGHRPLANQRNTSLHLSHSANVSNTKVPNIKKQFTFLTARKTQINQTKMHPTLPEQKCFQARRNKRNTELEYQHHGKQK
jgi:hypothetical protein